MINLNEQHQQVADTACAKIMALISRTGIVEPPLTDDERAEEILKEWYDLDE